MLEEKQGWGIDILLTAICIFVTFLYGLGGCGSAAVMDSEVMQCSVMAPC